MVPASALHVVVAAALVAAPVGPSAPPVQSEVPVQRPTSTAAAPAAAPVVPERSYEGVDALGDPRPTTDSPPAQTGVVQPPNAPAPSPAQTGAVPPQTGAVPPQNVPETELTVEGPEEDDLGPAYDPMVDSPEAIRARHWLHGGIVFTVVGGVLTIGGVAMRAAEVNIVGAKDQPCDNRGDPAGNGCTEGGRNRAAAALAIPGALLLAGGVAMLVVGKLQQRRLRASLQADKRGFMLGATLRF